MSDGELFQDGRSREQRPGPLKSETPSRKPNRRNREAEHGMPTSVDQVLQLLLSTAPSSVAMGVSGSTSRLSAGLPGQLAETGVGSSERARSRGPGDLVPSVPPRRGRAPSPVEQLGGDTVALDEALVRATERAVVSSTMANLQLTTTKKVASYYSEASKDLLLKNDALQETLRARDAGDSAIARYYREQLLDAMRESNKKLRDFQSSCESTALSTEARLAQQEEEIAKRDTRISEMEGVMAELQQELRGLETYVVERENIKQLLASQQQKYEEEIRKLQEEIASLRFGIIEEKVRVRADSKERESSFEKLVNERAVELLESTTAQIHSENIALREEKLKLGAEIQAALESCEALRRANAELRRRVSLAEDIEQRYATRGAKQSNEIKMLREQVAEMEKNMAAIVNEAKKSQSGVRVAANQRVEELQASRDEARSTAAARTRELAKLRAASKHLVRQRSDVETFLISALTEVRLRIAEGEATTSAGRPVLAQKRSCPQASATAGSSRVIPTAVPTLLQAPTAPKIDGYASELRMITCKGAERPLLLPPPSRGTSNREPSATREMPRLLLLRDSAAASLQSCRHGEVRAAADEMSVVPAGPRRQVPLGDSSGRGPGASLPRIAMSTAAASASALQGSCRGSSSAPHTGHTDADAERNEGCQRQGDDSSYQLTVFPERREESILPQTFNISDVQLCDIRCMSWSDMERVLLLLFRNLSGRRRREPEQAPMLRTQERRASYPETGPPPSLNAVASSERPPTPQVTGSPAGRRRGQAVVADAVPASAPLLFSGSSAAPAGDGPALDWPGDTGAGKNEADDAGLLPWGVEAPAPHKQVPPSSARMTSAPAPATAADDGDLPWMQPQPKTTSPGGGAGDGDLPWMQPQPKTTSPGGGAGDGDLPWMQPQRGAEAVSLAAPRQLPSSSGDAALKRALVAEIEALVEAIETSETTLRSLETRSHPLSLDTEALDESLARAAEDLGAAEKILLDVREHRSRFSSGERGSGADDSSREAIETCVRQEYVERCDGLEKVVSRRMEEVQALEERHASMIDSLRTCDPNEVAERELEAQVKQILNEMQHGVCGTFRPVAMSCLREEMGTWQQSRREALLAEREKRHIALREFCGERRVAVEQLMAARHAQRTKAVQLVLGNSVAHLRHVAEVRRQTEAAEVSECDRSIEESLRAGRGDLRVAVDRILDLHREELHSLKSSLLQKEAALQAQLTEERARSASSHTQELELARKTQNSVVGELQRGGTSDSPRAALERTHASIAALLLRVREVLHQTSVRAQWARCGIQGTSVAAADTRSVGAAVSGGAADTSAVRPRPASRLHLLDPLLRDVGPLQDRMRSEHQRINAAVGALGDAATAFADKLRRGKAVVSAAREAVHLTRSAWEEDVRKRLGAAALPPGRDSADIPSRLYGEVVTRDDVQTSILKAIGQRQMELIEQRRAMGSTFADLARSTRTQLQDLSSKRGGLLAEAPGTQPTFLKQQSESECQLSFSGPDGELSLNGDADVITFFIATAPNTPQRDAVPRVVAKGTLDPLPYIGKPAKYYAIKLRDVSTGSVVGKLMFNMQVLDTSDDGVRHSSSNRPRAILNAPTMSSAPERRCSSMSLGRDPENTTQPPTPLEDPSRVGDRRREARVRASRAYAHSSVDSAVPLRPPSPTRSTPVCEKPVVTAPDACAPRTSSSFLPENSASALRQASSPRAPNLSVSFVEPVIETSIERLKIAVERVVVKGEAISPQSPPPFLVGGEYLLKIRYGSEVSHTAPVMCNNPREIAFSDDHEFSLAPARVAGVTLMGQTDPKGSSGEPSQEDKFRFSLWEAGKQVAGFSLDPQKFKSAPTEWKEYAIPFRYHPTKQGCSLEVSVQRLASRFPCEVQPLRADNLDSPPAALKSKSGPSVPLGGSAPGCRSQSEKAWPVLFPSNPDRSTPLRRRAPSDEGDRGSGRAKDQRLTASTILGGKHADPTVSPGAESPLSAKMGDNKHSGMLTPLRVGQHADFDRRNSRETPLFREAHLGGAAAARGHDSIAVEGKALPSAPASSATLIGHPSASDGPGLPKGARALPQAGRLHQPQLQSVAQECQYDVSGRATPLRHNRERGTSPNIADSVSQYHRYRGESPLTTRSNDSFGDRTQGDTSGKGMRQFLSRLEYQRPDPYHTIVEEWLGWKGSRQALGNFSSLDGDGRSPNGRRSRPVSVQSSFSRDESVGSIASINRAMSPLPTKSIAAERERKPFQAFTSRRSGKLEGGLRRPQGVPNSFLN